MDRDHCDLCDMALSEMRSLISTLAGDCRETRADLARVEEALKLALGKLRDLESDVFAHRRDALNGLGALDRDLEEASRRCASDLGSLANRLASLEAQLADPRKLVARRLPPPDVVGVGEPMPAPALSPDDEEGD